MYIIINKYIYVFCWDKNNNLYVVNKNYEESPQDLTNTNAFEIIS